MFYVNFNGERQSLSDFYKFLYGVEPAKQTIHKGISPAVDVRVSENEILLEYELPGVNVDSINIQLEKNELSVIANKETLQLTNSNRLERSERIYGKYTRVFTIGNEYDADKLSANYSNGVLYIIIPRKPESKPKTFKIFSDGEKPKELKGG